nr:MAG TPA: hypothetical protein [Caudoviricetes sp.]
MSFKIYSKNGLSLIKVSLTEKFFLNLNNYIKLSFFNYIYKLEKLRICYYLVQSFLLYYSKNYPKHLLITKNPQLLVT